MQRNGRRHAWKDFVEVFNDMVVESNAEIKRIFEQEVIGKNALGTERTLEEFGIYSGLNFKTGEITNNC